ncbi:DUF6088 family protein [Nodularia chucula]|uniref:DUF6088 family protein n=1 Tax=Nodularia chucula TaxID=3093667 RepID=UPI0039C7331E
MFSSVSDKIVKRVDADGRGQRVYTPKDFSKLGSRTSVHQALSRLVKTGFLRRISRGLYDFPRVIPTLKCQAPPNIDAVIAALKIKYKIIHILPDGIVAANKLGLTNAVPAKTVYITDRISKNFKIGNRTICFQQADGWLKKWVNRPSGFVIQALYWLGECAACDPRVIDILRVRLNDHTKQDLINGKNLLPNWISSIIEQAFLNNESAVA